MFKMKRTNICRKRLTQIYLFGLLTLAVWSFYIMTGKFGIESKYDDQIANNIVKAHNLFSSRVILKQSKCEQPYLPVDNPEIMKHIVNVDRITCADAEKDWVVNNGTYAYVTEEAKILFGRISCNFIELERQDDFLTKLSGKITKGEYFKFETSDFVHVKCNNASPQGSKTWESFFASPRSTVNVRLPIVAGQSEIVQNGKANPKLPISILMWGHDSLSRNMFVRKMPLTYTFAKDTLGGITLEAYNIVGDGTPQALIPILTGKTEVELPETRKSRGPKAHTVDVYPFAWRQFRENGYITGYLEDQPQIGTFQFRLRGFRNSPTDYYMRPYFLAAQPYFRNYKDYCIGSVPRHKIMMNYAKYIFLRETRVPKFVFSFHSELSHGEANLIQGADKDLRELLTDLNSSNILNQTIVILMSDHGHRFAEFRETLQGKQEERKPIMLFVFPKWFEKVYPKAYSNFVANANLLSTPFDLHETLIDIMNLPQLPEAYFEEAIDQKSRGISLFGRIPKTRSCFDAGIEPHWCACLQWNTISTNETLIQRIATNFVSYLNSKITSLRDVCEPLELGQILWAANSYPKDELLQFKKSKDADGIIPDMSDSTIVISTVIQIKLETIPGNGHYEVSTLYDIKTGGFKFKETDISRINKYGSQASCLEDDKDQKVEHLRKYCFCKQVVQSKGLKRVF